MAVFIPRGGAASLFLPDCRLMGASDPGAEPLPAGFSEVMLGPISHGEGVLGAHLGLQRRPPRWVLQLSVGSCFPTSRLAQQVSRPEQVLSVARGTPSGRKSVWRCGAAPTLALTASAKASEWKENVETLRQGLRSGRLLPQDGACRASRALTARSETFVLFGGLGQASAPGSSPVGPFLCTPVGCLTRLGFPGCSSKQTRDLFTRTLLIQRWRRRPSGPRAGRGAEVPGGDVY